LARLVRTVDGMPAKPARANLTIGRAAGRCSNSFGQCRRQPDGVRIDKAGITTRRPAIGSLGVTADEGFDFAAAAGRFNVAAVHGIAPLHNRQLARSRPCGDGALRRALPTVKQLTIARVSERACGGALRHESNA